LGEGVWETTSSCRITLPTLRYTHHTGNLQGLSFYRLLLSEEKSHVISSYYYIILAPH